MRAAVVVSARTRMMSSRATDDDAVGGGEAGSVGRCGATVRAEKTQLRRKQSATVVVVALAIVMIDRSLDGALPSYPDVLYAAVDE
jgi:hypothetical protein